jgi:hypothetical protein
MAKLGFQASVTTNSGQVTAQLELYKFKEDNMYVIYCPAIDLSAYGRTSKEAEMAFKETFRLHISYCLSKKTLGQDLLSHGWEIKGKQKKLKAPTTEQLFNTNKTLRDIIFNKNYSKLSQSIAIPAFS